MGYKREINIILDLEEIRVLDSALVRYGREIEKDIASVSTKKGTAKKGEKFSKEFFDGRYKIIKKLLKFFQGLY